MKPYKIILALTSVLLTCWSANATVTSGASYQLISACDTTKALTIASDSLSSGASAVIATQVTTRNGQIFKIESVGGYYKLTNKNSGKVLDILSGSLSIGASVVQSTYNGSSNQLFRILNPSASVYKFQNVKSGLFVNLYNGWTGSGTKFQQNSATTSCAQRFSLKFISAPVATTPVVSSLLTDKVFAASSTWYTPIPANVTLNANSAAMVQDFLNQKPTTVYGGTVNVNTKYYSSPIFIAPAGAATRKVTQWDCQKKGYLDGNLAIQFAAVPIPANAQASLGTDAEMTIYQPSTNTLWELWRAEKNLDGTWRACWGGRMQNVSSNPGHFPTYFGTTATSLPFIAGQITAEELKRGEIRHAIGISLRFAALPSVFSWPAQRSDGVGGGLIPQGTRFRLDPTINVDSLNMHPMGKIIAKAAQKYGFIVWDTAGAISIRAQNVISYTALGQPDPYHSSATHVGLFGTTGDYDILKNFPWNRLQFLPMNYGKP